MNCSDKLKECANGRFNILSIDTIYEYENIQLTQSWHPKICIGERIKLAANF